MQKKQFQNLFVALCEEQTFNSLTVLLKRFRSILAKTTCPVKISLLVLILSSVSACNDNTDDNSGKPTGKQIRVSSEAIFLSEIDSQIEIKAEVIDEEGSAFVEQPNFSWQSDASNVVSVNESGVLTAIGLGEANVTVTASGITKVITVVVNTEVITVNGVVTYQDKELYSNGFTSRSDFYKAVRFAKVDLIAENGSQVLQTTHTDSNGAFSFSGVITSNQFITVSAKTDTSVGLDIIVKDRSDSLYAVTKQIDLNERENFSIKIDTSVDAAGAFNIYDVFINAGQFTREFSDLSMVSLAAFWEPNNSDGTYFCNGFDSLYCTQGPGVYVYNSVGRDTDEFDDDVLYHEFGHYFLDTLSRDDSYGGCHLLSSRDLDLRLSWSEGFGDFFPAAVKSWLADDEGRSQLLSTEVNMPIATYVDTYNFGSQIYVDLDTLNQNNYSTAGNELAISKILWSLYQRYGMAKMIKVLSNYLPTISTPVNLESFWDGWIVTHNPAESDMPVLQQTYSERLVYYMNDEFEEDNSISAIRKATLGVKETHYLYSSTVSTDLDMVAFDAVAGETYELRTSDLTSGADTFIKVYDSTGAALVIDGVAVENDDADPNAYFGFDSICGSSRVKNNGTGLSSKLEFTAPSDGIYYAEIRTTPDEVPYLSAGRYGTYAFRVSQK